MLLESLLQQEEAFEKKLKNENEKKSFKNAILKYCGCKQAYMGY